MAKGPHEIKFDRSMDDELKKLKIQIKEKVSEAKARGLDRLFADTCNSFNELMLENSIYHDKLYENFDEMRKNFYKSDSNIDFTHYEKIEKMKSLFYPSVKINTDIWINKKTGLRPEFPDINLEVGNNKYLILIKQEKKITYKSLLMNGEIIFGIGEDISSDKKEKKGVIGITFFRGDEWVKDFYKILSDFNLVNSIGGSLSDKELELNKFLELKKNFNL